MPVCDLEVSQMRRPWPTGGGVWGSCCTIKKVMWKFQKQSCPECSVSLLEPHIMEQTLYNTFISESVATLLPPMNFKTLEGRF